MCAWTSVSVHILNDCDATPRRNDAATRVTRWNTEPGNAWKTAEPIVRTIVPRRTPKRAGLGGVAGEVASEMSDGSLEPAQHVGCGVVMAMGRAEGCTGEAAGQEGGRRETGPRKEERERVRLVHGEPLAQDEARAEDDPAAVSYTHLTLPTNR